MSGLLDDSIDYRAFVQLLDEKNQRWVEAARGLSAPVIIDLLRWSGNQFDRYVGPVDLDEPSSVIWSGPEPTPRWFDLARDFTERWVHQQQIRDGRPTRSTTTTRRRCCGRSCGPCPTTTATYLRRKAPRW